MSHESRPEPAIVVVGHDRAAAGDAALRAAAELAARLSAELHVVHSVTHDDYGVDPDTEQFEKMCERNLGRERAAIADSLSGTHVKWTYHEPRGDPAHRLADVAEQVHAIYIVVGETQHRLLHHLLGGGDAVPRRLLHMQARPVLVVPVCR